MRKVSVGPTTVAGAGLALAQFIGALVLYLSGNHTAATETAVEVGAGGLLTSLVVMAGRYLQAHKQITVDAEQAEHALGLTTAQVEALIEQKLPELLPVIFNNIGKAVAGAGAMQAPVGQDPPAKSEGMATA